MDDHQFECARRALREDGVCILRGVIPPHQIKQLRVGLEEVFDRGDKSQRGEGFRFDMTATAARIRDAGGGGNLLEERPEVDTGGRFLTELEVGRWHDGVRAFELTSALPAAVARVLGETESLRFYMDHMFLKEAGSKLHTAWHQDAPYFPFECNEGSAKAAVCWVPVDSVAANSGGMHYIKGSHRWREYAPNDLVTNDALDPRARAPPLPDIDRGVREGRFEIIRFRNVLPGDVIVHHPNCVHGSGANVSVSKRRLAASIRYVGGGVRWLNKRTNPSPGTLTRRWVLNRRLGFGATALFLGRRCAHFVGLLGDRHMYHDAPMWAAWQMKDGQPFGATDIARIAFPMVWQPQQDVCAEGETVPPSRAHTTRSKL